MKIIKENLMNIKNKNLADSFKKSCRNKTHSHHHPLQLPTVYYYPH